MHSSIHYSLITLTFEVTQRCRFHVPELQGISWPHKEVGSELIKKSLHHEINMLLLHLHLHYLTNSYHAA
jgi:hypothetical protein